MTYRVLINEKIAESGISLLAEHFDVTALPGWDADRLADEIGAFDAILIRSATKLTADLVERGTRLKVIGRAGVGVDNVDLAAASARGIMVVNAPTSTVISAAEHTVALIFAVARNVAQGDATMKQGEWARGRLGGVELAGKTVSVLGLGRIGQIVADRCRALGMTVVGYDPFLTRERFSQLGVGYAATLEEALGRGDFVTLHMPLNDDTRGMVNAQSIALMPAGSRLINAARGALVDLDALQGALESGHLAGAGLDVYPTEPPPPHPVFTRADVVLTPHLAASTSEAQTRAGVQVAEQVHAALTGGTVTTAVNIPAIAAEDVEALQPFAPLAARLARLAVALAGGGLESISVEARGAIADYDVRMLSYSALIAVLAGTTDQPVTLVNARQLAVRLGIEVHESTDRQAHDFQNVLRVSAVGQRDVTVQGTTIGNDRPWLVNCMDFDIDIELTERMAFFRYSDVPGMIGRVGSAFGEARVNIANMAVSRSSGEAMMAVSFDDPLPEGLLEELTSTPGFEWGSVVSL